MGTVISIDYSDMNAASNAAKNVAKEFENYSNEIQRKVTQKLGNLKLGSNNNTTQANYFAQKKIKDLSDKKASMEKIAGQIDTAKQYAQEKDKAVARYIRNRSVEFRESHDMSVGVLTEFFVWMDTVLLNSNALDRFLKEIMTNLNNWIDDKKRDFWRWWKLEGGSYMVTVVASVLVTALAVYVLFCVALPALVLAISGLVAAFTTATALGILGALWTTVTAAAAFVTATLTVANGITRTIAGVKAMEMYKDDPGWARRYSHYSSFTDYLRKNNFNDGFLNKLSYIAANRIDILDMAASLINIGDMANRGVSFYQHIKEVGVEKIFDKVRFAGPSGKVTWSTFKYGLKKIFNNQKVIKTYMGNTNINRIQQSFKKVFDAYKTFKGIGDIGNWMNKFSSWMEKGTLNYSVDTIKSKIKSNTITFDYLDKIKNVIKNIKSTTKKVQSTPDYAYS